MIITTDQFALNIEGVKEELVLPVPQYRYVIDRWFVNPLRCIVNSGMERSDIRNGIIWILLGTAVVKPGCKHLTELVTIIIGELTEEADPEVTDAANNHGQPDEVFIVLDSNGVFYKVFEGQADAVECAVAVHGNLYRHDIIKTYVR